MQPSVPRRLSSPGDFYVPRNCFTGQRDCFTGQRDCFTGQRDCFTGQLNPADEKGDRTSPCSNGNKFDIFAPMNAVIYRGRAPQCSDSRNREKVGTTQGPSETKGLSLCLIDTPKAGFRREVPRSAPLVGNRPPAYTYLVTSKSCEPTQTGPRSRRTECR